MDWFVYDKDLRLEKVQGLLVTKSYKPFITWFSGIISLYLHYHSAYSYETLQDGDLS